MFIRQGPHTITMPRAKRYAPNPESLALQVYTMLFGQLSLRPLVQVLQLLSGRTDLVLGCWKPCICSHTDQGLMQPRQPWLRSSITGEQHPLWCLLLSQNPGAYLVTYAFPSPGLCEPRRTTHPRERYRYHFWCGI